MNNYTRRGVIATVIGLFTSLFVSAKNEEHPHQKIVWVQLTNEPIGPGDFWASENPNRADKQGDKDPDRIWHNYNLQMQAISPNHWGKPAKDIPLGNGGHWRPVSLKPAKIPPRIPLAWE